MDRGGGGQAGKHVFNKLELWGHCHRGGGDVIQ